MSGSLEAKMFSNIIPEGSLSYIYHNSPENPVPIMKVPILNPTPNPHRNPKTLVCFSHPSLLRSHPAFVERSTVQVRTRQLFDIYGTLLLLLPPPVAIATRSTLLVLLVLLLLPLLPLLFSLLLLPLLILMLAC